jgi:hypothetical protein
MGEDNPDKYVLVRVNDVLIPDDNIRRPRVGN